MDTDKQIAALEAQLEQAVYQASLSTSGLSHTVAENDVISLRAKIARLKRNTSGAFPERNKAVVPVELPTTNPLTTTGIPPVRGIPSSAKKIVKGDTAYYLTTDGTVIPANK